MQSKSFGKNILHGIGLRLRKWTSPPGRKINLGPLRRIYYKHIVPGKTRIHKLFGKNLYYLSATEMMHGLEEIFVQEIYKQSLKPGAYIIDCGANIGLSVIYLKQLCPDAEILAFEPDELNFDLLKANIDSFQLDKVQARKEAVWNENQTLYFENAGSMASKLTTDQMATTVPVQAVRLKQFLNRQVDFLKMDIEGAEFGVVMDILDSLHWVDNFFLEYHGTFAQNKELNKILSQVADQGFEYYVKEAATVYPTPFIRSYSNKGLYDLQLNIFFFRAEKR